MSAAIEKTSQYQPRHPETTHLYKTLSENLESFLAVREDEGSGLPAYVVEELRAYLKCGVIQYGFVRCVCECCGHEFPQIGRASCRERV